jgi:RNA polymerase sigma factor (sigma-70 family)
MRKVNLNDAARYIHRLFGEGTLGGLTDAQLLDRHVSLGDELAFEALVKRHGPMVLAVCCRVLNDSNDADDAFQAVFLLLARKARSLWIKDSLGGWLHRVSCRIAFQVKDDATRRRQRERRAAELATGTNRDSSPWDDTPAVIHEEIDGLPQRFRDPIVLCYLEHMTYQQAARHLRCSEDTTQGRLARGRKLLRARLARRGVALAGAALASVAARTRASEVTLVKFQAAIRSARQFGLGEIAEVGTVSTAVNSLVSTTMRSMMIGKLVNFGVAVLLLGTVTVFIATGLPATGRTIQDKPTAGSARAGEPAAPAAQTPRVRSGRRSGHERRHGPGKPSAAIAVATRKPAQTLTKDLRPGGRLDRGDSLFSALGAFRLTLSAEGELALYTVDEDRLPDDVRVILNHTPEVMKIYTTKIWSLQTAVANDQAGPASCCVMHDDGNFAAYDANGRIRFESGTHGHPGSYLRCQDDGNLVIYTPDSSAIWSSGTHSCSSDDLPHPILQALPPRKIGP